MRRKIGERLLPAEIFLESNVTWFALMMTQVAVVGAREEKGKE